MPSSVSPRRIAVVHPDPFDRLMVAQAAAEALTLATVEVKLAAYGVPLMDAQNAEQP
jgi:PIN domain nuclease of toxin-antitoxin system